jgi:putative methyltransferase (TIGR04325 family)
MLRKLIGDLTPPILLRPLQRLYRRNRGDMSPSEPTNLKQNPAGTQTMTTMTGPDQPKSEAELSTTFVGHYPSFEDIPRDAHGYDVDDLAAKTASPFLQLLQNAGSPKAKDRVDQTGRHLILPLVVSQFIEGPLTVIDVGGSGCLGLTQILESVPKVNRQTFRYINVDTAATCRFIREPVETILKSKFGTSSFVTIADDIPEIPLNGPLIVNLASSLQYVWDYHALLSRLGRLAPEIFIVSFVPVSDHPTYACQQTIHGHLTALRVFNRVELNAEMERLGFRLEFTVNHVIPVTFKDTPGPFVFASMVFRRDARLLNH